MPDIGPDDDKVAMAMRPTGRAGRGARRTKADKPQGAKRPLKLSVDTDTYERLSIHALRRGQNISEVVTELARRHLNDWVLHAKAGPKGEVA